MMKSKILFAAFLAIVSLYSCTTFKSVKSTKSINGTFTAFYNQKEFSGFFSISSSKLRLDIVNTFGLSVYGLYAQDNKVFLKDYQSGKVYKTLKVKGEDLSQYKPMIIYTMKNFLNLCANTPHNMEVLSCKKLNGKNIPTSIIFKTNSKRFRINLKNIKFKRLGGIK